MPTYSYACRDCGHRFDAVQSIHDDALATCEECGGSLKRLVSAVGVHFKGSGFYRTDSRESGKKKKSSTSSASSESSSSSTSASDSSTKSSDTSSEKKTSGETKAKPATTS